MPELPEVETVARALNRALQGRVIVGAKRLGRLRRPFDAALAGRLLAGREIRAVRRRAKYIIFDCGGAGLLAHLGMSGQFRLEAGGAGPGRHDRIVFALGGGDELRYADARRFGFVVPVALAADGEPPDLAPLGPEPLARGFTGSMLAARASGRRTAVKALLMEQTFAAGIGNIYASEILHEAGISPMRPAAGLTQDEWSRVAAAAKKVLRSAVRAGGTSIRTYRGLDGREGAFQRQLSVYGRAGGTCRLCGGTITMARLAGRATFHCPGCQR